MKVQTRTQHQFTYLGTHQSGIGSNVCGVGTHVSNILSEDGGQERAVPAVDIPVQQLRCHVRLKLSTSSLSLSLRLVALVVLQMHPLKENIPPGHRNFAVQYQFRRTRHPVNLLLHTN
jgi:hypothetical protein